MLEPSNKKQEHLISLCPELREICKPIFKILPIKLFRYVQSFKDGKKLILCSDETWLKTYFEKKFYNTELANFHKYPDGAHGISVHSRCEDSNPICQFWDQLGKVLSFNQIFSKYQKLSNYFELHEFAFDTKTHVDTNIVLNNLDLINKFILYFEDKAHDMIINSTKFRFDSGIPKDFDFKQNWLLGTMAEETETSMKEITPSRVFLDDNYRKIYLTLNESKCLKMLIEGKKYKEIATKLGYATRTIDALVAGIKEKLEVSSKADLILATVNSSLYHKLDLIDI